MLSRNSRYPRLCHLALVAVLLAAPGLRSQETWYAAYDRALEHIAAGRWQEAVDNLQNCLRLKPSPELNARTYGMWRQNYLPHYYLGLAWFNLGDYRQAEEHFTASEEAGVVTQIPELRESLKGYLASIRDRRGVSTQEQRISDHAESEIALAVELEEDGDLQSARLRLEAVLAMEPDNDKARGHLARVLEKIEMRNILDLRNTVDSLLNSGRRALARDDLDEAMDAADRALGIDPEYPSALALRQDTELRLKQRFAADERRRQEIDSLLSRGQRHLENDRTREARQEIRRILLLDPEHAAARRINARIDSIIAFQERDARRRELIEEGSSLLGRDSLIQARDRLIRAREIEAGRDLDSLLTLVEQRYEERERIRRERDHSQLVLNLSPDSALRVTEPSFTLIGRAFDNDGLRRILLVVNSEQRQVFTVSQSDSLPLRASFEETITLSEGLNDIQVVILDGIENLVTEHRAINYLPPFWRSTAFVSTWLILIIFSGGGLYYFRRNSVRQFLDRFRRRPFEPIQPNPFIVGNPIRSSEMFFGREDDFRFVKNKIDIEQYGSLIVLFGERRAGKTSVLYQILGGRLGPNYLPVFIDMQAMAVNDDWEFLGRIAELASRPASRFPFKFDPAGFEDRSRNPYTTFERFIDSLLESIGQNKLLLLVDEYELIENKVIEGKISKDIFLFLSGLVEHKAGLFLVFAGTHRLQEREQSYWQNLLQRCDYRNISYLTPNDTRRLIQDPVEGQVFYLGSSVARIMRLTAGQPFYTQLFCRNLVEFLNEENRNYFYEDDVAAVVREIVDNPPPQMIYFWAGLDMSDRLTLSAVAEYCRNSDSFASFNDVAELLKKHSPPVSSDSIKKSAERLVVREILEANGQQRFRFRMDLFRHWIREEHNLRKVLREMERSPAV